MARKNVKTFFKRSSKNWSHENKGCAMLFGNSTVNTFYQAGSIVVPSVTTQGSRTVGNFSITVPVPNDLQYVWALVYVPQGTSANNLFATTGGIEGSVYEPNQYVIATGINDGNAGPIRIRSKMQRRLHSGDFVSLIIGCQTDSVANSYAQAIVSYSIKYN